MLCIKNKTMNAEMLKTRTKKFGIENAKLCEQLPQRFALYTYSKQLIRTSSSVGANYRAACRAKSFSDFINKLKIVEEETDESLYFMELIAEFESSTRQALSPLMKEADELLSIIVASINTARKKTPNKSTGQ
jgi:four helix bundle protein